MGVSVKGRAGHVPARLLTSAALALAALVALPAVASAHPALLQSAPSPGLIAPKPATAVELVFSEPAVKDGSRITVSKLAGGAIPTGPIVSSNGGRQLSVKPETELGEGVYRVKWSALGDDGHLVGGEFGFGVAGKKGETPDGAQALAALGSRGGRADEQATAESVVTVIARWLGLICAAFLVGGLALLEVLRRKLPAAAFEQARERWRFVAGPLWNLILLSAIELVIAAATAGAGSSFDLSALFASPSGVGEVAQLVLLALASVGLIVLRKQPERRDWAFGAGGVIVLVTQALTGHVQTLDNKFVAGVLQLIHVGSAGVWLGGLLALLVVTRQAKGETEVPFGDAARAFAPVAAGAFGAAVITGVLAAIRELPHLYFVRWSSYGHLVLIKSGLVLLALAAAGITAWRLRQGKPISGRLVRWETLIVVGVLVVASMLTAFVPGRGQPLPAQKDNLLPGPALASAVADSGPLRVSLAPARSGTNSLSAVQDPSAGVTAAPSAKTIEAKMFCSCAGDAPVTAQLHQGAGGTWSSSVDLPKDGPWYARLIVDGKPTSPVALPVGVPKATGPGPLTVLSIADLSGADADRCRDHLIGLELGIGRINALGGLDGGRKVAVLGLDDGGSPEKAKQLAEQAISSSDPIALAAPCGPAAAEAVKAAGDAGVPSIVADPALPLVNAARVFRLAGDPYAEGYADGQYINQFVKPAVQSKVVTYVRTGDAANARRLAGVRAGLQGSGMELKLAPESALLSGPDQLRSLIEQGSSAATIIDGDPGELEQRFAALGVDKLSFAPDIVIAPSSVLSERFIERSGAVARIGALQGPAEVQPNSQTSISYVQTVPAVFPGEQPSLDGLRGYLAGLALAEGVKGGTGAAEISSRLVEVPPFADALLTPWRADATAAGSQLFNILRGTFLPGTLIPQSAGGESFNGIYFPDGSWTGVTTKPLGPSFQQPVPPIR